MLRPRVKNGIKNNDRGARQLDKLLDNLPLTLSTTLVGTNISIVMASLMAVRAAESFGLKTDFSGIIVSLVMTFVILISDIIPKNWARRNPYHNARKLITPFLFMQQLLYLPSFAATAFSNFFISLFVRKQSSEQAVLVKNDFRILLRESENGGIITAEEATLLDAALDITAVQVKDIMVPAEKLIKINADVPIAEALATCRRHNLSRLPVTTKENDCCFIFSIYEVIGNNSCSENDPVSALKRPAPTVSINTPVTEILKTARSAMSIAPMMIVVDDSNHPVGLLTPQDIVRTLFYSVS